MESKAKLVDVSTDFITKKMRVTFELDSIVDPQEIQGKDLRLTAKIWRNKRSLDANGLLWVCLDKIASALNTDKWEVYLLMLKRYGKFTYVLLKPNAVEYTKSIWRESEVVGEIDVNGEKAVQMLCYFGSSSYDTKEFSRLLDGVISEMKEMGLDTPAQEEMDRMLAEWGKKVEKQA